MVNLKDITICIDMDDVLCNFSKAYATSKLENPDVKWQHSLPNFFENLEPIEGGIEMYHWLNNYFTVYILTAPSVHNPLNYTEKRNWAEKHLGFDSLYSLILSPDKGMIRGDYLIDDNIDGKGQESFKGQLIHFGQIHTDSKTAIPMYDWSIVKAYFENIIMRYYRVRDES